MEDKTIKSPNLNKIHVDLIPTTEEPTCVKETVSEMQHFPISNHDLERALIALGIEWEKTQVFEYTFKYHGYDTNVILFSEGIEVVYKSQIKLQDEGYMTALENISTINRQMKSGFFVLDFKTKKLEHRFIQRCCNEDSISTTTLMFALCVGCKAFDDNHSYIFSPDSEYIAGKMKEDVMYK